MGGIDNWFWEGSAHPTRQLPQGEEELFLLAIEAQQNLGVHDPSVIWIFPCVPIHTAQKKSPGLPWWRSGWESACQCRGHGFEPWSGKIPHAAERLGPWATIAEPARLEPVLRNGRGHDSERPAHRDEEWSPLAATRESPRTETKTQHSHR